MNNRETVKIAVLSPLNIDGKSMPPDVTTLNVIAVVCNRADITPEQKSAALEAHFNALAEIQKIERGLG